MSRSTPNSIRRRRWMRTRPTQRIRTWRRFWHLSGPNVASSTTKCDGPAEAGHYIPMTSTSSLTDAADFFKAASSSAVSLISMICSTPRAPSRSEEHTSELQSLAYLVCRLLLEKKKISNETMDFVARQLSMAPVQVYDVVSFLTM